MRDKRVTTHLALVGRAFGASGMYMLERDEKVEESVQDVCTRWGGDFSIEVIKSWKKRVEGWNGPVVHLTMYGLPVDDVIDDIRKRTEDVLVVVGSEKVPGDIYKMADYNVSVGNQPHSEISALALFLDRYFRGKELKKDFKGSTNIVPSKDGKKVIQK
jgi:tRNA (cytidine56-2'-O)-methyltransferase